MTVTSATSFERPDLPDAEFRVLGALEHGDVNAPTVLGGRRQKAVLAMLLHTPNEVVTDDAIIDGVWADDPPGSVKQSLHTYISNLRGLIGSRIERFPHGYLLRIDADDVDAIRFERLTAQARATLTANPERTSATLRGALGMWRGRPYADLIDVPGLQDEIRRLEDVRLLAVESRIDADLAAGRHSEIIGEIAALAAEHPFKESLLARHMLALYRDGRQAEALRVYQLTRELLGEELGVEPSPELRELEGRILQHDPSLIIGVDTRTEAVALLFTDIAGSTSLWEANPDVMGDALAVHDEIVHAAITKSGGRIVTQTGDGALAAFADVGDAGAAAVTVQQRLASADWGRFGSLDVKTAIDVGEVEVRGGRYLGPVVNRGARLAAAAHGGQILLSSAANEQLSTSDGVQTRSLGEHRFRGLGNPEGVFQLVVNDLPADFPPLDTDDSVGEGVRHFGDAIRGYELREQLGSGRFGVVYRAYQPAVGREVAVKVIRPEYANHSVFVRSFESEARLVAKLSHPHIVPLFDFWRDNEGAYLVTPLLSRGSLADVEGALSPERVGEIVRQIGSALAYAHRQGVIHRNVKPSNLLVDGEGNVYVSDFGMALRSVEEAIGAPGPSSYRAPEAGTGVPVSEGLDVYGLAAVAAELLSGQDPSPSTTEALPEPLNTVIRTGLAPDPSLRHPTVDAFVAAWLAATGQREPVGPAERTIARNPYKGLSAFDEADGRDFFGRTKEINELLSLVERHRIVTVVGPSGSGKSSLVKAGLVPALRARRPGEHLVVTCVPGAHPFDELATAIGGVASRPLNLIAEELRSDQHGLLRVTKSISMDLGCEIVIIVDQFEELYSLVGDDATRASFVESLLEAGQDPHSKVRIVTTIRADFFDHPLLDGRLGNVVADAHLTLAVPGEDALLEAIEGPAALVGLSLEDGIPNRIVSDVKREPGALPLLQFVLTDLVDHAEGGRLTGLDYDALGGATGALANRATAVYEGLAPVDRETAHHVLLRMVTVSEDADDVRRRVRRAELESLGLDPGSLDHVIGSFTEARLLTLDRDAVTRGPTVEVAHEALIREWDLLGSWISDKREALIVRRRLGVMLQDWLDGRRADDLLPVGTRLSQFEDWIAAGEPTSAEERTFVEAAVGRREAVVEARRRRRNRTIAGFAFAAVVASVLAVFASIQWRAADTEATRSRARELIAVADSVTERDPELALLVALEAVDEYTSVGDGVPVAAQQVLHDAIASHRVVARIPGSGEFATVKPDGSALATTSEDGGYAVWDISGGEPRLTASFAPPGGLSAVTGWWEDGPVLHALVSDQGESWWLAGVTPDGEWREEDSWIAMPAGLPADMAPDSSRFAYLDQDGISLFDTADGRIVSTISGDDLPTPGDLFGSVQFGPSGHLFFGSERDASIYDVWRVDSETGAEISLVTSTEFAPESLVQSPNGRILFIGGDSVAANVEIETGEFLWQQANTIVVFPYWLSEDRVAGGGTTEFTVIDAPTGETVRVVPANRGDTDHAHVAGTGLFASSGTEGVSLIDVGSDVVAEVGPRFDVGRVTFDIAMHAASGLVLAVHAPDSVYSVADAAAGEVVVEPADLPDDGPHVIPMLSRDASLVAAVDETGVSHLRRTDGDAAIYSAPAGFRIIGISDDGALVVETGSDDGTVGTTRLVRTNDGATMTELDAGDAFRAVFSPDGGHVTITTPSELSLSDVLQVFDSSDGRMVNEIAVDALWPQLTPDGRRLVAGSDDGTVLIYDFEQITAGAEPDDALMSPTIAAHSGFIYRVVLSPDGTKLLTAAFNEPARLWDLASGDPLGRFGTGEFVTGVGFHASEPWVFIAEFGTITSYTYDPEELVQVARDRLTRTLTEEECELYLLRPCDTTD